MPVYRLNLDLSIEGDDVSWVDDVIEQLEQLDGVSIDCCAPYADNPPNFPDEDDWDDEDLEEDNEDED